VQPGDLPDVGIAGAGDQLVLQVRITSEARRQMVVL
jgi:hypothetical protein